MKQHSKETDSMAEVGKGTQEAAKTADHALYVGEKFGGFISRIIGGSLEQAAGIFEDKLKYHRWERQIRFMDRVNEVLADRRHPSSSRPVPLNVAIPIFEAASLEEDDDLQDLWARLLANAADADSGSEVRRGFVSILQDFGHMEARLLQVIHDAPPLGNGVPTKRLPDEYLQPGEEEEPGLPPEPVQIGLWNLMRLGCIDSAGTWDSLTGIRRVQITALGKALFNACSASPEFERQMAVAKEIMHDDREVLRELAK